MGALPDQISVGIVAFDNEAIIIIFADIPGKDVLFCLIVIQIEPFKVCDVFDPVVCRTDPFAFPVIFSVVDLNGIL